MLARLHSRLNVYVVHEAVQGRLVLLVHSNVPYTTVCLYSASCSEPKAMHARRTEELHLLAVNCHSIFRGGGCAMPDNQQFTKVARLSAPRSM